MSTFAGCPTASRMIMALTVASSFCNVLITICRRVLVANKMVELVIPSFTLIVGSCVIMKCCFMDIPKLRSEFWRHTSQIDIKCCNVIQNDLTVLVYYCVHSRQFHVAICYCAQSASS